MALKGKSSLLVIVSKSDDKILSLNITSKTNLNQLDYVDRKLNNKTKRSSNVAVAKGTSSKIQVQDNELSRKSDAAASA